MGKLAKAFNATDDAVYKFADRVRKFYGYKSGNNLRGFVKDRGGKINFETIEEWEKSEGSSIKIDGPGKFQIHISKFESPLSDSFIIAHELGHYFIHSNLGKIRIKAPRFGKGRVEREADCFAASFLMPEKEFKKEYKRYKKDIDHLSSHFFVTPEAVIARGKLLNVISKNCRC